MVQEVYSKDGAAGVSTHFRKFGIKANTIREQAKDGTEYDMVNIKYDRCEFEELWMYACRGTTFTIRVSDSQIVTSHFAPIKFFNKNEFPDYNGSVSLYDYVSKLKGVSIVVTNKEDGSAVMVYYNKTFDKHFVKTLGTVSQTNRMQQAIDQSPSFTGLTMELMYDRYPQVLKYLKENPNEVFFAELKSPYNHIVTEYDFGGNKGEITPLFLIQGDGTMSWKKLSTIVPGFFKPDGTPKTSYSIRNTHIEEDVEAAMKQISSDPKYGQCPEGGVLSAVDANGSVYPLGKLKLDKYLEKHNRLSSLEIGSYKDLANMQTMHLCKNTDDLPEIGRDIRMAHCRTFQEHLDVLATTFDKWLPRLISARRYTKAYADIVNRSDIPRWAHSWLFRHRTGAELDDTALSIITMVLLETHRGTTKLETIQAEARRKARQQGIYKDKDVYQAGTFWWKPPSPPPNHTQAPPAKPPQLVVLCDVDGTLLLVTKTSNAAPHDYNSFESQYYTGIDCTVNSLKAYQKAGAKIIILTGRSEALVDPLSQHIENLLGFPVTVRARPEGQSVMSHKLKVVSEIADGGPKTIVHFEDDKQTLVAAAARVEKAGIRYLGHRVNTDEVVDIISRESTQDTSHPGMILAQTGPPGSGKSTIAKCLKEHLEDSAYGGKVTIVSSDELKIKLREANNGKSIDKEDECIYKEITRKISKAVRANHAVIVDMSNESHKLLDMYKKQGVPVIRYSLVPHKQVTVKTRKGDTRVVTEVDPDYAKSCIARVKMRQNFGDDGSTLHGGLGEKEVSRIWHQKATKCLGQITNEARGVHDLSDGLENLHFPDDHVKRIQDHVQARLAEILEQGTKEQGPVAYLAAPVCLDTATETQQGHVLVPTPHITFRAPTTDLRPWANLIGTPIDYRLATSPYKGKFTTVYPAQVDTALPDAPTRPHVTQSFEKGKHSFVAYNEVQEAPTPQFGYTETSALVLL